MEHIFKQLFSNSNGLSPPLLFNHSLKLSFQDDSSLTLVSIMLFPDTHWRCRSASKYNLPQERLLLSRKGTQMFDFTGIVPWKF